MNLMLTNFAFATSQIAKDPGVIIGPILKVLGFIIDFIYKFVSMFAEHQALGLSVILLTVIARTIILPLAFRSQKSMTKMQMLQPEIAKIKAKYGDSKDPEIQRKMQMEQQALYGKHKVNPLSGCVPMLVTLPIFFALNSLFRETYRYIGKIGDLYARIAETIMAVPGYADAATDPYGLRQLIFDKLPGGMGFSTSSVADMMKAVNIFTPADWSSFISRLPVNSANAINGLLAQKEGFETFLTINMVNSAGLKWPGIIIPILVALTTVLSSLIMMWTNPNQEQQAKTQHMIMMVVMPVMMFMFTINMSSGVGIYWITSSVYQTVQQYFLNNYYRKRLTLDAPPALKVISGETVSKSGGNNNNKKKK